jgi:hypothetical protein
MVKGKMNFEKTATNPFGMVPPAKETPPAGLTSPQAAALHWLRNRNGTGVFEKSNNAVLVAAGSRAPIMRSTWVALQEAGFVTIEASRVTVTPAGLLVPYWPESRR